VPVMSLDHVNIRAPDYPGTIAFLRDALGMVVTAPPGLDSTDKAAWVCDERGLPVLHVSDAKIEMGLFNLMPATSERGSGAIHHVALGCQGFDAVCSRLASLGLDYKVNEVSGGAIRQLFVKDPSQILFELNFCGD